MPVRTKWPSIQTQAHENGNWILLVNGKTRLIAEAIFETKIFGKGNLIAVIYWEKAKTKLLIIILDPPMEEYCDFEEQPMPGFTINLLGSRKKKEFVIHFQSSSSNFYVFRYFFSRMQTEGPFGEKKAMKLLEKDFIKYKSSC